jgi:glycine/D-amino acid oxidase-like deaminating enzyme
MKWVTGECVWPELSPIPAQYPYLSTDITADVAVIGGGITGTITAWRFARAGIDTLLVEKNILGYNSSAASTSILQYEIDSNLTGLEGLYGIEKAVRAFQLTGQAVEEIGRTVAGLDDDCGFRTVPCLYYTDKVQEIPQMRREFDLRLQHGFPVTFLDRDRAASRFAFPVAAGIFSSGQSAVIDPYRCLHALVRDGVRHGLQVYENTEVAEMQPGEGGVTLRTRNGFTIRAGRAVITTGYDARNLIHRRTALLTRSFVVVTRPLPEVSGWPERCTIRDNESAYTYIRQMPEDRLLIGGLDLDLGGERSRVSNLEPGDSLSQRQYQKLLEKLNSLFPTLDLSPVDLAYRFSGIFADTKDSLPYIGAYAEMPGCLFNLGYGANGIPYAMFGARMLADLVQGRPDPDMALFAFDR